MKILILTDSLALPRDTPELVNFDDCWIEILKRNVSNINIHQVSIGGATIRCLWEQYLYNKLFYPDIIILQNGIVDCSPRAFTGIEQKIINSNFVTRKIGNFIIPFIKAFLRKTRNLQRTPLKTYIKYVSMFALVEARTIAISILPSSNAYEISNPGITRNIKLYNSVLEKSFEIINISMFTSRHIMSDHHHLNEAGHELLANLVLNKIKELNA